MVVVSLFRGGRSLVWIVTETFSSQRLDRIIAPVREPRGPESDEL